MRKLIAALCAVALGFAFPMIPAQAQFTGPIYCNAMGSATAAAAQNTKVVSKAATGTSRIFICGYSIQATGGTSQLVYGTQTTNPCDTGQVILSPLFATTVVGVDAADIFRGMVVPSGNDVCVVSGAGATAVQAFVFYAQQ